LANYLILKKKKPNRPFLKKLNVQLRVYYI